MKAFKVLNKERKSALTKGEFALSYEKGHIVNKVTGSFGIFCFATKKNAELFINYQVDLNLCGRSRRNFQVVEVEGNIILPLPEVICSKISSDEIIEFYEFNTNYDLSEYIEKKEDDDDLEYNSIEYKISNLIQHLPYEGVILFESVKVLT